MNYNRHRKAIERLYEDTATIKRTITEETAWHETRSTVEPVTVYVDQPCRISQKSLSVNNQTEVQNTVVYQTKLFISPDLEIHQGDTVEVTRRGVTKSYTAGEPFLYPTHQEVILLISGEA